MLQHYSHSSVSAYFSTSPGFWQPLLGLSTEKDKATPLSWWEGGGHRAGRWGSVLVPPPGPLARELSLQGRQGGWEGACESPDSPRRRVITLNVLGKEGTFALYTHRYFRVKGRG